MSLSKPPVTADILQRIWNDLRHILYANIVFSFFINALMLLPSVYMLQVYDRVLSSRNMTTLFALTLLLLALYGLMSGLEWVRSNMLIRAGGRLEEGLNHHLFTAAFVANVNNGGGDIRQAIGDLTSLRQFFTGGRFQAFLDAPWAPIYLAFCFVLHPTLGWFALASCITLLLMAVLTEHLTKAPLIAANQASQAATSFAGNQVSNAEAILAMGMLPAIRNRWLEKHGKMLALQAIASDRASVMTALSRFFKISVQSLGLGLGAYLVITDGLSPGAMIAVSILVGRTLAPIEGVIGNLQGLDNTRLAYSRLKSILAAIPAEQQQISLPPPKGDVHVEALFAAPPSHRDSVIKGISFSLAAGTTLVIAGPSGSGKSTLARLLIGIWPAARGSIRLDGVDVFNWNKTELGPWVGYLPQDVEVLEGTIAENIARFGEPNSAKIVEAAQRAGIHDMILQFPQGYDTPLGVNGSSLSGGQRQRIALARAIYGDPALVVLDEPNSNLDDAGEIALIKVVRNLKQRGKTVVIVSHRSNIVAAADRLMILKDGQIVAFGPTPEIQRAIAEKINKPALNSKAA